MTKNNTYLIACVAAVAAATNAHASVLVEDAGSSINLSSSADNAGINAYDSDADTAPKSFTMTGGSVTVSTTGLGAAARGVFSRDANPISVSGGTMTISESGDKDATLFRMNDHGDSLDITGGTFNLTESGDGAAYGVRFIRDGEINISGGTWNFSQDVSSEGAIFLGGNGAAPTINLSGGLFNNLDQFDTHIDLSNNAGSVFNLSGLSLIDTGLTYSGNAIQDLTGEVAGTLADGNDFAFNFVQAEAGQMTTSVVPEPSTYTLLAGLTGLVYVMLRRRRA